MTGIAQEVVTNRSHRSAPRSRGMSVHRRDHHGTSFTPGGDRMIKASTRITCAGGLAVARVIAAALHRARGAHRPPRPRRAPARRAAGRQEYKIGYSNGAASATASARSRSAPPRRRPRPPARSRSLTSIHRNTDAAGQLSDIRDLIAKGVNAIVFNPNDPAPSMRPSRRRRRPASRRSRSTRTSPTRHLQPLQQPGQVRGARRQVAVRSARRQGHGLVHPRPRRPSGRQRP